MNTTSQDFSTRRLRAERAALRASPPLIALPTPQPSQRRSHAQVDKSNAVGRTVTFRRTYAQGLAALHGCTVEGPDPTDPQTILVFIGAHGSQIPPHEWEVIEGFVRDAVRDLHLPDVRRAKNYFTAISRLVHWAHLGAGYPLDRQVIFRRDIINAFIFIACKDLKDSSRATYRSRLHIASDRYIIGPRRKPQQTGLWYVESSTEPYTGLAIDQLRMWARFQPTEIRRNNLTMALALGLGAGLTNAELCATRFHDIEMDDEGVLIHVHGARARQVPVLAEWEEPITKLKGTALKSDMYVFAPNRQVASPTNLLSNMLNRGARPPAPVTCQKMRSTWIVRHLAAGVPHDAIMRAAGLAGFEALARFMRFVPSGDGSDSRALLRGARTSPESDLNG